jgi:hypothetical protein
MSTHSRQAVVECRVVTQVGEALGSRGGVCYKPRAMSAGSRTWNAFRGCLYAFSGYVYAWRFS